MIGRGARPLEPFPGTQLPWKCFCLSCGEVSAPRYNDVVNLHQLRWARCDRRDRRKLTLEAGLEPLVGFPVHGPVRGDAQGAHRDGVLRRVGRLCGGFAGIHVGQAVPERTRRPSLQPPGPCLTPYWPAVPGTWRPLRSFPPRLPTRPPSSPRPVVRRRWAAADLIAANPAGRLHVPPLEAAPAHGHEAAGGDVRQLYERTRLFRV